MSLSRYLNRSKNAFKGGEIGFDREKAGVKLPVEFVGNSLKN